MWKVCVRECFNSEPIDLYCEEIDLSNPSFVVLCKVFCLEEYGDVKLGVDDQKHFSELDPIYYNPQLVSYMGQIIEKPGLRVVKK